MVKLTINRDRCKACGLCQAHCPKQLLRPSSEMNLAGYHPTTQIQEEDCSGCGICALMCPDICFTITKVAVATPEPGHPDVELVSTEGVAT